MSQTSDSEVGLGLASIFDLGLIYDMQRELIMLVISVGGYVLMANYNSYLDRLEEEEREL